MSDTSAHQEPDITHERDPDDELVVEPDLPTTGRQVYTETDGPDADRALRGAGGDADRAEDLMETEALLGQEGFDVPADERPV